MLLDADTRPSPDLPVALVARAVADGLDLLSGERAVRVPDGSAALAAPGAADDARVPRSRRRARSIRGPCTGGWATGSAWPAAAARSSTPAGSGAVGHHTVEDVALVRTMATAGFAVGFLDASELLTVRMYETAGEAWRGWGRSLSLPGVDRAGPPTGRAGVSCRWPRRCRCSASPLAGPTPSTPCCSPSASARWPARRASYRPRGAGLLAVADRRRRRRRRPGRRHLHPPAGLARPHVPVNLGSGRVGAGGGPEAQADERHERAGGGGAGRPSTRSWATGKAATATRMPVALDVSPGRPRRRAPRATAAVEPGTARSPRRRTSPRPGHRGSGRTPARRGRPSPPPRRRTAGHHRPGRRAGPADRRRRPRPWRCRRRAPGARRRRPSASLAFQ